MFTLFVRRGVLAVALCALLLVALSCSSDGDEGPTAPVDTSLDASGTIGVAGGTIASNDGRLKLTVPAGALASDTEIVITEVATEDVAATAEGLAVTHALTMEPANLPLAAPITLVLQYEVEGTEKTDLKVAEIQHEMALQIAVVSVEDEGGEIIRAVPQQEITVGPPGSEGSQSIELDHIPPELVLGQPVAAKDGESEPTIVVGFGRNVPAQAIENTEFLAEVAVAYSAALVLASDVTYGPAALANLVTLLETGESLDYQEAEGQDNSSLLYFLFSYLTGIPGPATWNLITSAHFEFQPEIAFPDLEVLPAVWGTISIILHFAAVEMLIQEPGSGDDEVGPDSYFLRLLIEAGVPIRGLATFPYNNSLVVCGDDGTVIYSLGANNPFSAVNTSLQIAGLLIWDAFLVGSGLKDADPASLAMVQVGPGGARLTSWIPEDNTFGMTAILEFQSSVTDAQPYGGDPYAGGFVYVAGLYNAVRMLEYNSESGFWDISRQINNFPDAPGSPFTATLRPGAGAVVVTEGSPGKIYHHDLEDVFAPAVAIGDAGDSPRRIRMAGNLAVISNFESDELTILSWSPEGAVDIVGSVPVGDGPVGIDALELSGGNVAVVSAGFNDNTSTVTILDAAGAVVSNTTTSLPADALAPGHAFWLRGEATHYGVSCNESGHVVVIDPGLE